LEDEKLRGVVDMNKYTDRELKIKINTFLTKKLQKFPDLQRALSSKIKQA